MRFLRAGDKVSCLFLFTICRYILLGTIGLTDFGLGTWNKVAQGRELSQLPSDSPDDKGPKVRTSILLIEFLAVTNIRSGLLSMKAARNSRPTDGQSGAWALLEFLKLSKGAASMVDPKVL